MQHIDQEIEKRLIKANLNQSNYREFHRYTIFQDILDEERQATLSLAKLTETTTGDQNIGVDQQLIIPQTQNESKSVPYIVDFPEDEISSIADPQAAPQAKEEVNPEKIYKLLYVLMILARIIRDIAQAIYLFKKANLEKSNKPSDTVVLFQESPEMIYCY